MMFKILNNGSFIYRINHEGCNFVKKEHENFVRYLLLIRVWL